MKVVLDLHDATPLNMRWDILLKLKNHFDDFRVSLFWIPVDKKMDYGPYRIREELLQKVKENLDWIQLIPHGLYHESGREFLRYDQATFKHDALPKILDALAKDGLPFEKGFCSPHWYWSQGVVDALDEIGWWGAVLREDKGPETKRFYRYTHLLNEPFWESNLDVLKLHGHIYGTKNDVGLCLDNLMRLPKDTQFAYVTDYLETK